MYEEWATEFTALSRWYPAGRGAMRLALVVGTGFFTAGAEVGALVTSGRARILRVWIRVDYAAQAVRTWSFLV